MQYALGQLIQLTLFNKIVVSDHQSDLVFPSVTLLSELGQVARVGLPHTAILHWGQRLVEIAKGFAGNRSKSGGSDTLEQSEMFTTCVSQSRECM